MLKKTKLAHPLIVIRVPTLSVSQDSLLKTPAFAAQKETIRQIARDLGRDLKPVTLINRAQSKFDPASCKRFQNVLDSCESESDLILIDDYLRLIDFRDLRQALDQGAYLQNSAPKLFSIAHASFIKELHPSFLQSAIKDRVRQSELRSKSIKEGLKENAELFGGTKPSRKAIDKAAKNKSRIADHRARVLFPEIELIRQALPSDSRENFNALAEAMNAAGVETSTGRGQWQGTSVKRILDRIDRMNDTVPK